LNGHQFKMTKTLLNLIT